MPCMTDDQCVSLIPFAIFIVYVTWFLFAHVHIMFMIPHLIDIWSIYYISFSSMPRCYNILYTLDVLDNFTCVTSMWCSESSYILMFYILHCLTIQHYFIMKITMCTFHTVELFWYQLLAMSLWKTLSSFQTNLQHLDRHSIISPVLEMVIFRRLVAFYP